MCSIGYALNRLNDKHYGGIYMLELWLSPVLTWLGIGLIPFLIIVLIIIIAIRG